MDIRHENLGSCLKVSGKSSHFHIRPTLTAYRPGYRDPKWMKLFHPKSSKSFKAKGSRLHSYSIAPIPAPKEVQPKFTVNTMKLYKVLVKSPSVESLESKPLTERYIPEFSTILDKNQSISKISFVKSDFNNFLTSRPSTATIKNIVRPSTASSKNIVRPNTARTAIGAKKKIEMDYLPDKGNEFVSEVIQIWEKLGKRREDSWIKEDFDEFQDIIEDMDYENFKTRKNVIVQTPDYIEPSKIFHQNSFLKVVNNQKVDYQTDDKKKPIPRLRIKDHEPLPIELQAQPKILTQRSSFKLERSNSFNPSKTERLRK
jgi:hypothetical protein